MPQTFHRDPGGVVVLPLGIAGLAGVAPGVLRLHVVQVEVGPRHADLVVHGQLVVLLLPADLWDRAGRRRGGVISLRRRQLLTAFTLIQQLDPLPPKHPTPTHPSSLAAVHVRVRGSRVLMCLPVVIESLA